MTSNQCNHCAKTASLKCGTCLEVWYCCTDCQKADWQHSHKKQCTKNCWEKLIRAIDNGDKAVVKKFSKIKRVVNAKFDFVHGVKEFEKWTALHHCVFQRDKSMLQLIMNGKTVNVNIVNADKETPLFVAAQRGQINLVAALLKEGADPNVQTKHGWTAIVVATRGGFDGIIDLLMKAGADPFEGRGKALFDFAEMQLPGRMTAAIRTKAEEEGDTCDWRDLYREAERGMYHG